MADDPKKPIEELLNDFAQQRRQEFGSSRSMPGPMRDRLHAEVRRQLGEAEPRAPVSWWPKLAFAAAIVIALLGGVLLWQRDEFLPEEDLIAERQVAPMAAAKQESDRRADAPAVSQVEALSAAPAEPVEAATQTFNFAQTPVEQTFGAEAKLKSAVLNSFELRQSGNEIRVVDADGSTYTGEIVSGKELSAAGAKKTMEQPASRAAGGFRAGEAKATEHYFRASGENRSLNKSIVFEGNLIVPDEPAPARRMEKARLRESGARIVGHAKINGEEEIPIDAVSVDGD